MNVSRSIFKGPARARALAANAALKRKQTNQLAPWLFGMGKSVGLQTARANWEALNGDANKAAKWLAEIVARHPSERGPVISLGALLSFRDNVNAAYVWDLIYPVWSDVDLRKDTDSGFRLYTLGIELLFILDPERAEKEVRENYFPYFWNSERVGRNSNEPVLFWHVPKSGGTSVSSFISKSLYRSGMDKIPSYTTRRLLRFILNNQDGLFPYLSTAHLSARDIGLEVPSGYKEFTVLRDPVSRAISAWRQYRQNPAARLWILPQHGAIWNYYPTCSLLEWCKRVPQEVSNPLGNTFGSIERLQAVNSVIHIDEVNMRSCEIFEYCGLKDERVIKTSKNETNKKIRPDASGVDFLKKSVVADEKFYDCCAKRGN